jgi:hypothetical protein
MKLVAKIENKQDNSFRFKTKKGPTDKSTSPQYKKLGKLDLKKNTRIRRIT